MRAAFVAVYKACQLTLSLRKEAIKGYVYAICAIGSALWFLVWQIAA